MHQDIVTALDLLKKRNFDELETQLNMIGRKLRLKNLRIDALYEACDKMSGDNGTLLATANEIFRNLQKVTQERAEDQQVVQETTNSQNEELQKANARIIELMKELRLFRMYVREPCDCCGKSHRQEDVQALERFLPR